MQKAIADYLQQQKSMSTVGVDPSQYGKMEFSDPFAASKALQATKGSGSGGGGGSDGGQDAIGPAITASAGVINAILSSAIAAEQEKREKALFKIKSDENNREFYDKIEMARKREAASSGRDANRSTFGASDTGIKTAMNSHDIGSSGVNNIVNSLAKAYLTKG